MAAPESTAGEFAAPASLRRIERAAVVYAVVGAVAAGWIGGLRPALALTAAAAASIVAFRGLRGFVLALLPPENEARQRSVGRAILLQTLRFLVLGGGLAFGYFLDSGNLRVLIAGVSVLPGALLTEGGLQVVRALRGG